MSECLPGPRSGYRILPSRVAGHRTRLTEEKALTLRSGWIISNVHFKDLASRFPVNDSVIGEETGSKIEPV